MALLTLVLGATLGTWTGFYSREHRAEDQNDAQDSARTALDKLTRQLRNLASPTNANVKSIDKATPYDLVFQTLDPAKRRVRYCLNASDPSNETLWMQTQAFGLGATDPGLPPTADCPQTTGTPAWAPPTVVAEHVVNKLPGDRPVFGFDWPSGATDTALITRVSATLYLDTTPGRAPAETTLSSGVYLRNQNQAPTASFAAVAGSQHAVTLNGSESSDPEGRTLDFYWYSGTGSPSAMPDCLTDATRSGGGFTCLGRGPTLTYSFESAGNQTIWLKVIDPGGLYATASKVVTVK